MANMQRRSVSGTSLLSSSAQQRTIALPLLPENGAWSITGTIFAVRVDPPGGMSVAYYPLYAGYCNEGVATVTTKYVPPVSTDHYGSPPIFAPGGPALTITNLQAEITFTGAQGVTTIAWGWELDVVLMSLP
jgi:hypothetical protein